MTYFDASAKEYSSRSTIPGQRHFEALNFLPQSATRALDAGCGSGALCLRLADHVNCVVGLDISQTMIALAKSRLAEQRRDNVYFIVADLESPPFGDGTFDFAISSFTLHNTQLDVTLPRLRQLVRPGGRMVVIDLVTRNPRLYASPLWHVWVALRRAPRYAKFGLRTMWRVLSYQLNPAWIRHKSSEKMLTPESFQTIYSHFLPGCRFERRDLNVLAVWEASK